MCSQVQMTHSDGSTGVTNAICPGPTKTPNFRRYHCDCGPKTGSHFARSRQFFQAVDNYSKGMIPANDHIPIFYWNGVENAVGEIWLAAIHIDPNLH
jgi:hypothetical protein